MPKAFQAFSENAGTYRIYETGEAEFVPVEVQMNQFLEDVKKLVTYRLQEKKICLEIHCNPEELRKTFDPDLMMSAVTNLLIMQSRLPMRIQKSYWRQPKIIYLFRIMGREFQRRI